MNTERFTAACHAMQGILANSDLGALAARGREAKQFGEERTSQSFAREAVECADALLAELAKTEPKEEAKPEPQYGEPGYFGPHDGGILPLSKTGDPLPDLGNSVCSTDGTGSHAHQMTYGEAKPEADAEGWIPHKPGDPMPCDPEFLIYFRMRNMGEDAGKAGELRWSNKNSGGDIIAWKPA